MHRKIFVMAGLLMAISITLSSFTSRRGGDSFTIHLNNKLLLQQHLYGDKTPKTISLKEADSNDELRISFSHCGQAGKSKTLTVKNSNNKVLKQWNFTDRNATMICKVKEILSLEKGNTSLQLIYTSTEIPKGQILASIVSENISTAKK